MNNTENEFSFKSLFIPLTTLKVIHYIIILGIIIYFKSLFNGFVGDDNALILTNPNIHSLSNIPLLFTKGSFQIGDITGLYYRPIPSVFYTLIYSFAGENSFFYHLIQVSFHITNSLLLYLLFKYFFNKKISLFLSIIFLVHPINTETVVNIANFQDILFFFFGSLALILELRLKNETKRAILVPLFLFCSIFSKETGILFVFAVLVYAFTFRKEDIKKLLISSSFIVLLYLFLRIFVAHIIFIKESSAPIMNLPVQIRLLSVPSILLYYIKTSFYPQPLAMAQQWIISLSNIYIFYLSLFTIVLITITGIMIGRVIYHYYRKLLFAYIYFSLLLLSGLLFHSQLFFSLDGTVADRWFYFPIVGLLGIIAVLLQIILAKKHFSRLLLFFIAAVCILLLSTRAYIRSLNFYDNFTLYSHDIQYSNQSSLLTSSLGNEYMMRGNNKQAEKYLLQSVSLDPSGLVNWNTLGTYYQNKSQDEKAIQAYKHAIKNGSYYEAYQNLTILYLENNELQKAENITKEALQKYPTNGVLWQYYAIILSVQGNNNEALLAARQAIQYNPSGLSYVIYNQISQNLPIKLIVGKVNNHKSLHVCPPSCE